MDNVFKLSSWVAQKLTAVDDSKIFDKVYYYMHILLEKDEIFQAKLHIRMRCLKPTNTIWLNAVNLSILTDSVSMSTMKSRRLQIVQFLDDEPNQLIGLKFDENLTTRVDYSLKFNNFSGIISQKSRHFGLFRNIHFSQNSTLATQFQLNSARQVFPCFDQPDQKAIFWLKMTFDGRKFAALSNGRVDQRSKKNSWEETTTFQNTPLMSTYTFAFCLLPIDRFKNFTSDDGNVKFQIFYDKYTFSDSQVAIFMGNLLDIWNC
uniref:Aminopeptidase N-like N-terminal domain-containing protein n=1 Tax=Romanomermis culicivorax TaxID=13658 RepID=A0A915I263_ROMCU